MVLVCIICVLLLFDILTALTQQPRWYAPHVSSSASTRLHSGSDSKLNPDDVPVAISGDRANLAQGRKIARVSQAILQNGCPSLSDATALQSRFHRDSSLHRKAPTDFSIRASGWPPSARREAFNSELSQHVDAAVHIAELPNEILI